MGFFSKVKSAVNKLTGGGASVSLSVNNNVLKENINVTVSAVLKDNPLDIKKVYLWVKSVEKINIPKESLPVNLKEHATIDLSLSHDHYLKKEFLLADAQTLEGNQTYTWSIDIRLDGATMPSYNGHFANHEWLFYAGLDTAGNDPDSGWQKIDLI